MARDTGTRLSGAILVCLVALSAAVLDSQTLSQIDDIISSGMSCKHIPGLAVAIVKDGQVLLSKGYGVKDLERNDPVTADTLFQIASTSKAFTGALLSDALARNRSVGISYNVRKLLPPGFRLNNDLRTRYSTLEDLLAHRLGVPRHNYVRFRTDYSPATFYSKLRYLPHKGGFRDSFYYNDLFYGLSAYITERLGGQPWKQMMRDRIFTPLGMTRSTFVDDVDFDNADVASPYLRERSTGYVTVKASTDFVRHWGKNLGSGNLMSSANDMAQWLRMLLADGKSASGARVLRAGVLEEVFRPQNFLVDSSYAKNYKRPVTPESFSSERYALGWRLGYYRGLDMIHHSGSTFGYRALLTLLPTKNVGVITLMTGSDYQYKLRTALHAHLMDSALGHAPWINTSSVCTFPEPWRSSAAGQSRQRRSVDLQDDMDMDFLSGEEEEEEEEEELSEEPLIRAAREASGRRVQRAQPLLPLSRYVGTFGHRAYGDLRVSLDSSLNTLVLEYGIGLWRLEAAGGHAFEGRWMKAPPNINKEFVFQVSGGSRVNAVQGKGFESSDPPVFERKS